MILILNFGSFAHPQEFSPAYITSSLSGSRLASPPLTLLSPLVTAITKYHGFHSSPNSPSTPPISPSECAHLHVILQNRLLPLVRSLIPPPRGRRSIHLRCAQHENLLSAGVQSAACASRKRGVLRHACAGRSSGVSGL